MNYQIRARFFISVPIVAQSILIFALFKKFFSAESLLIAGYFGATAVLSVVLANLLLSSKIRYFSHDALVQLSDGGTKSEYFEKLGGTPVLNLRVLLILAAVSIAGFGVICIFALGVDTGRTIIFETLAFSISMLCTSFAYVLSDRNIISFLYNDNVFNYPDGIYIQRQRRKNFIIPTFMSFMSLLFALSMVFLQLMNMSLHDGTGIDVVLFALRSLLPYFILFLLIELPLVAIWAMGTSLLYHQINTRLEEMVSGDKDLTKKINISSADELATVSHAINVFSDMVRSHMVETGEMFAQLGENQEALSRHIDTSTQSVQHIGRDISGLSENVEREYNMVKSSLEIGKTLIEDLSDIVENVSSQSASVSESSAAVEEMIASISEVSSRTASVKQRIDELSAVFSSGEEKVKRTVQSVENVVNFSKNLMGINGLISDIAAQTNLLAMNAAIEAAHAGDAGRGFSVVADEIRKLAEHTATHTKTSGENLNEIVREIETSLNVAQETGAIFADMKRDLGLIDQESHSISETMIEHDRANKIVLEQLAKTNDLAQHLSDGADQISNKGNAMLQSLVSLEEYSGESFSLCSEVDQQNSTVLSHIEQLVQLSTQTEEISRKTLLLVQSYKVK